MQPNEVIQEQPCVIYDFCEAQSDFLAYGTINKQKSYIIPEVADGQDSSK